jgi:hypothetical protein
MRGEFCWLPLGPKKTILPAGFHLEWTSFRIRWQIHAVGQTERPTCRKCGTHLILAPAPDAKGLRSLSCEKCEPGDPLKSATACGWIMSELRPPT